jgi:hypothetical protein
MTAAEALVELILKIERYTLRAGALDDEVLLPEGIWKQMVELAKKASDGE